MDKTSAISLLRETFIGYSFFSLVHALGPMIWFYPLNELDVTGYEAFVVVAFSPILFTCGKTMNKIIGSHGAVQLFLVMMLGGCASFHSPTTLSRLVALSVGVAAAYLKQAATWWNSDEVERKLTFWGHTLGFFALLASRIWYVSIMPMWSDRVTNKAIVTLLAVAIGIKMLHAHKFVQAKKLTPEEKEKKVKSNIGTGGELIICLGYGATFFMLHAIFGEVSIVSRFTVKGFPDTGPMPNPWGGLILVTLTVGILISMMTDVARKPWWSLCGFASAMGLMFLDRWLAYSAGCFLATYTASVWPTTCENLINTRNPGKSLVLANAIYLLGVFGMVWCTAYNFVPFGGELARERTYVIVAVMMILIALSATSNYTLTKSLRIRLSLPEKWFYVKPEAGHVPATNQGFPRLVQKLLFGFALIGLLGFRYRELTPKYNDMRAYGNETVRNKEFSALIWAYHFGYDNRGWPSLERAAKLLNDTGADVITLLESDASKPYLGNNDLGMWLGERLGMHVDFGPSTRDHTWGNLLLSKHPIVKSQHHLLPSPHGELAPAISATVNVSGNLVDFVVTHMGNDRDNLDRKLQAQTLADLCDRAQNPVVFLGYVTSAPGSRDYKKLTESGRMKDIDSGDKYRWCEYIMYRGLTRLGYARISHGGLSDTELQMGKWRIPNKGDKSFRDNDKMTSKAEEVPESVRFNQVFGSLHHGHWYGQTHNYHMDTPKYFLP